MTWLASLLSMLLLTSACLAATPSERRDQLARVQELLADPDPLARIVNMESIIKSGDQLQLDIALRTAFSSNDQQLRGLALRAYVAHNKTIDLDVVLPPSAVAELDQAERDGRVSAATRRRYEYVSVVRQWGSKIHLNVRSYTFPDDRGLLETRPPAPFSVAGDRFTSTVRLFNTVNCSVDFTPTSKLTFDGTLACDRSWPSMPVSATIY